MSVLIKHMAMPKGCIYANDKDQTDYCPMLNHDDVPFCQYIENEPESAIGIDERPVYCPLSDVPDTNVGDMIYRQAAMERLMAQNVIMDGSEYHDGFNAGVNRAQTVIRNLPPVQPTITHEQAIDYLHKTGWLQNHDRILTESKMMMPVQPIIYCEKCLYKKICSWKNQGAEFCSFGERGKAE